MILLDDATPEPVSDEDWKRLYALAAEVHTLAPWEWMTEDDVFGVRYGTGDDIGFVSVMGRLKEHFAIAVYEGWIGLERFRHMQTAAPAFLHEAHSETPHLMLSFEDRTLIEKDDYEVIRRLGLRYRGRNAWPRFRAMRPGYFPWRLDEHDEAERLARAIDGAVHMARRLRDAPDAVASSGPDSIVVIEPEVVGERTVWTGRETAIPPPPDYPIRLLIDEDLLDAVAAMPRHDLTFEIDYFICPTPVGRHGERLRRPYALMLAEPESGYVLGVEMLEAPDGPESLWPQLAGTTLGILAKCGVRPARMCAARPVFEDLLAPIVQRLGIDFKLTRRLPAIKAARKELFDYFGAG